MAISLRNSSWATADTDKLCGSGQKETVVLE